MNKNKYHLSECQIAIHYFLKAKGLRKGSVQNQLKTYSTLFKNNFVKEEIKFFAKRINKSDKRKIQSILIEFGSSLIENKIVDAAKEKNKEISSNKKSSNDFYKSWEWKKVRYNILKKYGAKCMLCGSTEKIVVDHIKPRSKYPELELNENNMQVLCNCCNMGKSNDDETDFRPRQNVTP